MKIVAALAVGILAIAPLFAADDAPVRYHSHGMTVILHSGTTPIPIKKGRNPLDRRHTFNCESVTGCVVVMTSSHFESAHGITITCAVVDGETSTPGCIKNNDTPVQDYEQAKVAMGPHTIQTIVNSAVEGGTISGWVVEYRIYERKVRVAD